jgi:hypothetical protein
MDLKKRVKSVEERLLEQKLKEIERQEYLKTLQEEGERLAREQGKQKAIEELRGKSGISSSPILKKLSVVINKLGSSYMQGLNADYNKYTKTTKKKEQEKIRPFDWLYE